MKVGSQETINFGTWTTPIANTPVTGYALTIKRCPFSTDVVDSVTITTPDLSSCETVVSSTTFPSSKHSTTYTPVQADNQTYLIAVLVAKNKIATSDPDTVLGGPVGGQPTLADAVEEGPTVTADNNPAAPGDTLTLDMGTWNGSPTTFRYITYICSSPTDTTTCFNWDAAARLTPAVEGDTTTTEEAPDLSPYEITDYFFRFFVTSSNDAGFSDGYWSSAQEVVSPD